MDSSAVAVSTTSQDVREHFSHRISNRIKQVFSSFGDRGSFGINKGLIFSVSQPVLFSSVLECCDSSSEISVSLLTGKMATLSSLA